MSAPRAGPGTGPPDPVRVLRSLPQSEQGAFLSAYRDAVAAAADPGEFSGLLRLLRLWSAHAAAMAVPGYHAAREAARGPVAGGMLLDDYVRSRRRSA